MKRILKIPNFFKIKKQNSMKNQNSWKELQNEIDWNLIPNFIKPISVETFAFRRIYAFKRFEGFNVWVLFITLGGLSLKPKLSALADRN